MNIVFLWQNFFLIRFPHVLTRETEWIKEWERELFNQRVRNDGTSNTPLLYLATGGALKLEINYKSSMTLVKRKSFIIVFFSRTKTNKVVGTKFFLFHLKSLFLNATWKSLVSCNTEWSQSTGLLLIKERERESERERERCVFLCLCVCVCVCMRERESKYGSKKA